MDIERPEQDVDREHDHGHGGRWGDVLRLHRFAENGEAPRRRGAERPAARQHDELRQLWHASARIPYPYGPLWQLLLLTGQRRSEIAHARWREIDTGRALLTVPPERFKSNATHIVPLSSLALRILATLPRDGDHLFGRINGFGKAKRRLDHHMGDVPHFVIHDIRRTVRTRLSALRVPSEVAEMIIGHGRKGLLRVYDQHHYLDEMRAALDLWAKHLSEVVGASHTTSVS